MASDSDVVLVPDMVEYTTDEEGRKRVGFIEGEKPKMSPLPEDKEKEKEEDEKAIKAMESLNSKRMKRRKRMAQERRGMRLMKRMTTVELTLMLSLRRLSLLYLLLPRLFWRQNLQ